MVRLILLTIFVLILITILFLECYILYSDRGIIFECGKCGKENFSNTTFITLNPTFEELVKFIKEDNTDKLEYSKDFTCINFANTFVKRFREKGYYSCVVDIEFENTAHAIVVVNTSDRGIVYIEPQNDKIIFDLKVGDNYCEKVGWYCNWVIKRIVDCFNT